MFFFVLFMCFMLNSFSEAKIRFLFRKRKSEFCNSELRFDFIVSISWVELLRLYLVSVYGWFQATYKGRGPNEDWDNHQKLRSTLFLLLPLSHFFRLCFLSVTRCTNHVRLRTRLYQPWGSIRAFCTNQCTTDRYLFGTMLRVCFVQRFGPRHFLWSSTQNCLTLLRILGVIVRADFFLSS